jgi:hypothetical protein
MYDACCSWSDSDNLNTCKCKLSDHGCKHQYAVKRFLSDEVIYRMAWWSYPFFCEGTSDHHYVWYTWKFIQFCYQVCPYASTSMLILMYNTFISSFCRRWRAWVTRLFIHCLYNFFSFQHNLS